MRLTFYSGLAMMALVADQAFGIRLGNDYTIVDIVETMLEPHFTA